MQERLPKPTYKKLMHVIKDGEPLDLEIANEVAHAMKEWALEHVREILTYVQIIRTNPFHASTPTEKSRRTCKSSGQTKRTCGLPGQGRHTRRPCPTARGRHLS